MLANDAPLYHIKSIGKTPFSYQNISKIAADTSDLL